MTAPRRVVAGAPNAAPPRRPEVRAPVPPPQRGTPVLTVDPIACDGHGLCAELLPEWIRVDDWGYPIVPREALPPELESLAARAVKACPTLALRLRTAGEDG